MADFTIKRNDTAPILKVVLKDTNGNVIDLSGATVMFHMVDSDGNIVINKSAVVTSPTQGEVSYLWEPSDTSLDGGYSAEWEVTFPDGRVETFPNSTYISIEILADLA